MRYEEEDRASSVANPVREFPSSNEAAEVFVIEGPDRQFFGADDTIRIVHDHQQVSSRWEFEEVAMQGTEMRRNPRHSPAFAATIWLERGS